MSVQVLHCREKNLKVKMLKSGNKVKDYVDRAGGKKSKDSKFLLLNSLLDCWIFLVFNWSVCLTFGDPMDCSPAGSPVHGLAQARILE